MAFEMTPLPALPATVGRAFFPALSCHGCAYFGFALTKMRTHCVGLKIRSPLGARDVITGLLPNWRSLVCGTCLCLPFLSWMGRGVLGFLLLQNSGLSFTMTIPPQFQSLSMSLMSPASTSVPLSDTFPSRPW